MLTKTIEHTINPICPNIKTVTTTWCGFNARGEWVYHTKTETCYTTIGLITCAYYNGAINLGFYREVHI